MRQLKSCGIAILRRANAEAELELLVMQHAHRWDLPKGHIEDGEDEWQCACRECFEETGIAAKQLRRFEDFRHEITYQARYKRFGGEKVEKTVVIFAAGVVFDTEIQTSEHASYSWIELPEAMAGKSPTVSAVALALFEESVVEQS